MPSNKPIIAIVGGTGREGSGLALRLAAAGYEVIIGSRQVDMAIEKANVINQQLSTKNVAGMENKAAAQNAQICFLTVIPAAHDAILETIKDALQNKILVDATSNVDYHDPKPPSPPCSAEVAQNMLGGKVKVVAAFQNVPAKSLRKPISEPLDADVLACSDDIPAAEAVIELAEAVGMRGYYAGKLANAIVVEGMTSILISLNTYYGYKDASITIKGISKK